MNYIRGTKEAVRRYNEDSPENKTKVILCESKNLHDDRNAAQPPKGT